MKSPRTSVLGVVIASFLGGVLATVMFVQVFSLMLGNSHVGSLYGGRGTFLMYETE